MQGCECGSRKPQSINAIRVYDTDRGLSTWQNNIISARSENRLNQADPVFGPYGDGLAAASTLSAILARTCAVNGSRMEATMLIVSALTNRLAASNRMYLRAAPFPAQN
jgi:hypothetical protein